MLDNITASLEDAHSSYRPCCRYPQLKQRPHILSTAETLPYVWNARQVNQQLQPHKHTHTSSDTHTHTHTHTYTHTPHLYAIGYIFLPELFQTEG